MTDRPNKYTNAEVADLIEKERRMVRAETVISHTKMTEQRVQVISQYKGLPWAIELDSTWLISFSAKYSAKIVRREIITALNKTVAACCAAARKNCDHEPYRDHDRLVCDCKRFEFVIRRELGVKP